MISQRIQVILSLSPIRYIKDPSSQSQVGLTSCKFYSVQYLVILIRTVSLIPNHNFTMSNFERVCARQDRGGKKFSRSALENSIFRGAVGRRRGSCHGTILEGGSVHPLLLPVRSSSASLASRQGLGELIVIRRWGRLKT